jgi:two-component system heavy metal sensor histidine kinase CusS
VKLPRPGAGAGDDRTAVGEPGDSARALREKRRLLAALVVHDLRSPLAAAIGYIGLLREELGEPTAQASAYLGDVETLLGKALGLVATILDVDELEDGMLHAHLAPVRLVELVERARDGNRAHFEVRQLRCDVDIDPELVVRLDRDLFGRVIENMLDNATRYAPRGGRCGISARPLRGGVELAIGNSGPPVPLADREQIFGRYFQVERRRASARENRGLGLYFCKLAVEAHGGTIHVEERGDLGAVFVAWLPEPPTV